MKKIIVLAITLSSAGFCVSPEPVNQISILRGCSADAGKIAAAISTPTFTGSGQKQFLVVSTDPMYNNIVELATQSAITGKNTAIDFVNVSPSLVNFNYQLSTANQTSSACYNGAFYSILNFSFRRQ